MEYIHYNPVPAAYVLYQEEYKYSSPKFYESGEDEFGFITTNIFALYVHFIIGGIINILLTINYVRFMRFLIDLLA